MGLGGFFDYSKPGPGINKNAPEKHTFVVFFETWFRNVWRLLPSGCIYVLLNLFLIPSGLGSAGLTNIARNMARDKHSFGFSDFIDTIKRNWKQSLVAGILNVVVTTLVVISGWLYYFNTKGWMGTIGASLMITAFFVLSVMKISMLPAVGAAVSAGWAMGGALAFLGLTTLASAVLQGKTATACIYAVGKNGTGSGKYVLFPAMVEFYAILALVLGIMV